MYFLQFIYLIASILLVTNADEVQKKGDMNSYLKRTAAKFMEEVAERPNIQRLQNGLLVEVTNFSLLTTLTVFLHSLTSL